MTITRVELRRIIEQVVGYKAPKKSSDDNTDYLQMGSSSVAAEPGSQAAIKADRDSAASLTKDRQDALDKDDLDAARTDGHQLQMTDDELQNEIFSRPTIRVSESVLRAAIRQSLILESTDSELASLSGPGGQQAAMDIQRQFPDAFMIYEALRGLGTNEDQVMMVLNKREDSIPALYSEFDNLMATLADEADKLETGFDKYGPMFLKNSAMYALALGLTGGGVGAYTGYQKGDAAGRKMVKDAPSTAVKFLKKGFKYSPIGMMMTAGGIIESYGNVTEVVDAVEDVAGAGRRCD